MITIVVVYKQSQNAGRQPTDEECHQVLQILNSGEYHERVALRFEDCEDIQFDENDHCHATARKIADANRDRGWKRVSGYLIIKYMKMEQSDRLKQNYPTDGIIDVKHHSVVKDNLGNLVETMEFIYPLENYVFICHPSGSLGWDLRGM